MSQNTENPTNYINPLSMYGLSGRVLEMPAPKGKKREILFIYGHHASIERHFGVAAFLNRYGAITMPDLPGFGGMETFYKIGKKPSLDNMADYLADFIKMRYKGRRLTIGGYSLGVMVATRMLQKNPEIASRVDIFSSIAGFTHKDDFGFKRRNFIIMRWGTSFFSRRWPAAVAKFLFIRGPIIKLFYHIGEAISFNAKSATFQDAEHGEDRLNFEVHLWECNDLRTYMDMAVTMFTLDLTAERVNLPVYHAAVDNDHYFNDKNVEKHMRMIFSDVHLAKINTPTHSPSVVATADDAALFIPIAFRKLLNEDV